MQPKPDSINSPECQVRHRADNLINDYNSNINTDALTLEEMTDYITENKIPCPQCHKSNFTEIRNEITPRNFVFRTIEFEQMEYQTFCKKGDDNMLYAYYKEYGMEFFEDLGIKRKNLRFHNHEKLAHYAKAACDIEYLFPFGWGEINGTHNRTDYDLKKHQKYSGKSMEYFDWETNEKYIPYVIESTYGLDRLVLALISECLETERLANGEYREILKIKASLAPYQVSVLPLNKVR